jgi:hypothetical protein
MTASPSRKDGERDAFTRLYSEWLKARANDESPDGDESDEASMCRLELRDPLAREITSTPAVLLT